MKDYLAIIQRVIEEHQAIRGHIKLVGDSISDREALARLLKASDDWVPGRPESPTEMLKNTQQALSALEEGLKNHFFFEGEALPPLLGELLMQALILEHGEIMKEIIEVKSVAAETKLEGLNREELLVKATNLQQKVSSTCFLIEEHATREEVILDMLKRALESKNPNRGQ